MHFTQKLSIFLATLLSTFSLLSVASAAVPSTLALTTVSGDAVQVRVTGAPSSNVQLSFLAQGSSSISSIAFGTTDGSGNFTTVISSGGYGIPQNSPVYITIGGVQSPTILWPTYASSLTLSQTNITLSIGQNSIINGSTTLITASNSATSAIASTVNGSQLTITGLANGSGTVVVCGAGAGCGSVVVTVGAQGQSQITFSQNNFSLNSRVSKTISIYGGSVNGYSIKSNSNAAAVQTSLAGTSGYLTLYGNDTPGTAAITVCSVENSSNCSDLLVTIINTVNTSNILSFSQNNFSLIPGLTQAVSIVGSSGSSYFISSNSNSSVALATITGSVVNVVGGNSAGSTVIVVCSTSVNSACGNLNVSLTTTQNSASATTLAFSQNVVTVNQGATASVTVSGGTGTGYVISSNSSPTTVTASITGSSSSLSLFGNAAGTSLISVCSASSGAVCANVYVTVGTAINSITFSQNTISLSAGGSIIVPVTGGSGTANVISSISNPSVATAALNSSGTVLVVSAGNNSGTSAISICPGSSTTGCGILNVSVGVSIPPVVITPAGPVDQLGPAFNPSATTAAATTIGADRGLSTSSASALCQADALIRGSGKTVYYCGADGKRYVFPNAKTFASWFPTNEPITVLSDVTLGQITIGGNVTYRPGVRMIKITTDPKVYAVSGNGTLRWIMTADLAAKYYGASWAKQIDDIPDAYFTNYKIGADITQ
ncbi:MAG: hypothetical protein NT003_04960 [Candidatus Magasanikbacteria bacterium]|nr:hypothetical protein [Candidatus Magasanikbacteria bacterium]